MEPRRWSALRGLRRSKKLSIIGYGLLKQLQVRRPRIEFHLAYKTRVGIEFESNYVVSSQSRLNQCRPDTRKRVQHTGSLLAPVCVQYVVYKSIRVPGNPRNPP